MTRRTRRALMAAAVLATVMVTVLTLRWMASSGTTDSASAGATLTSGTATDVVTLTIDEPAVGTTAIDVRLTPRASTTTTGSATPVVTVSAVLPTVGHAVPDFTAVRTADNRYHVAGLPLMMTGRWELLVDIDTGDRHDRLVFPLTISR